jgi:cysteinyl-tRNA synthetase
MLSFFNTLTRKKQEFVPLEKGKVKIYTCGPTVWDFAHIGNFRAYVFQDMLRRWLEYRGYDVTQVMNITDVDDHTIEGSRKEGIPLQEYTKRYINAFFEDMAKLNIEKAEFYPKATEHVQEMVGLVKTLMKKGYAYRGEDGSIYYDISKFIEYGKLSKTRIEELKAGARVKADYYGKEEAHDFALWKAWEEEDGDVYWETELGKGRPGWHIECSVMSMKYLGETFDIHCGGVDLIFPHHENEIAQSEAATGKKFVNYWIHHEHLLVERERMSKSLGNSYTLRDLLEMDYNPMAVRYVLLSTHYRQQLNFTFKGLDAAKNTLERLVNFAHRLLEADGEECGESLNELMQTVKKGFEDAMDDDLNINIALASLFNFIREVNKLMDQNRLSRGEARKVYDLIMSFDRVLDVLGEIKKEEELPKKILSLIERREKAREDKEWETADKIRKKLRELGITLEDTPEGVKWRKKE